MIRSTLQDPNKRKLIQQSGLLLAGYLAPLPICQLAAQSATDDAQIVSMEAFTVNATERTNWIIVRLTASNGITGLGEASLGRRTELPELNEFFALVQNQSGFDIQAYRQRGWSRASSGNRSLATAFSAIEQAMWDIVSKTMDVPLYNLFGGKLNEELPVYANINRATALRTPEGFAATASQAVADGFQAIKAAPFDGFPALDAPGQDINRARQLGVDCVFAMREAVGESIQIKIDAHSFFDVQLAIDVARELESANLSWYEEPIAPTQTDNTKTIHDAIEQTMAGGEFLFGMEGFGPLCESKAVDIIMPDVKHCGGLLEALRISSLAEYYRVLVSPHNPSGPVSTAASVALCAALPNFDILEYQWGEVDWRSQLTTPFETIENGSIKVSNLPGIGIELNEEVLAEHRFG